MLSSIAGAMFTCYATQRVLTYLGCAKMYFWKMTNNSLQVDDTDPGSVSSDGDDDFKLLETSESADETDLNSETSSSPSRKSRKTRR